MAKQKVKLSACHAYKQDMARKRKAKDMQFALTGGRKGRSARGRAQAGASGTIGMGGT
jgi:hypothetical protein